jgi:endonuclease/exonuclease/phosphatase family metal-dependent hydrolase
MRHWCLALIAAALVAEAYLTAGDRRADERRASPLLRVLTYNIHHGEGLDGRVDLERQAAIMSREAPDLIALQEVDARTARSGGVDQLAELARLTGMSPVFGKAMDFQGGAYGVGVLSRVPLRRVKNRRLPGSPGREPRTALSVEVDPGERGPRVQFTTTHLDNGREAVDKLAQASFLANAISPDADDAGILAGDMNTRFDTPPMQLLARRWTDTFVEPPPDPSGRPRRRIDYVMVRPADAWRVVEARFVSAPMASDHQPMLVVLEWIGSPSRRTTR